MTDQLGRLFALSTQLFAKHSARTYIMSDEAESSGQALERVLKQQIAELAIEVPEDDLEMMARFVEEEGLEKDEKVEGVRAMLEGFADVRLDYLSHVNEELIDEPLPDGVDEALNTVMDEYDRLKALELEAEAEAEAESSSSESDSEEEGKTGNILDTLTPEELKQAQKQALLRQYAYVDADPDELAMAGLSVDGSRDPNAPPRTAREKQGDKEKEERRKAIEEALRLDGKKKKHRKNKEGELEFGSGLVNTDETSRFACT